MKSLVFDVTQKERGRILENYTILRKNLENQGYICEENYEPLVKITEKAKHDLLIFACPDNSKLTDKEIESILNFIKEGKGLLILNHAGGDKGLRTNLGELTSKFGFYFNNDEIFDYNNNLDYPSYVLINNIEQHEITKNITNFCYRIGCSLILERNIPIIAHTDTKATPPNAPIFVLRQYGKGRVAALGSYELFRDEINGGISYEYNLKLAINLFNWLLNAPNKLNNNEKKNNSITLDVNVGAREKPKLILKQENITYPKIQSIINSQNLNSQHEILKNIYKKVETLEVKFNEFEKGNNNNVLKINNLHQISDNNNQIPTDFSMNELITNINMKIDDLTIRQSNFEKKLNQLAEKFNLIEKELDQLKDLNKATEDNSPVEKNSETEPEFIKASELILLNSKKDSKKLELQSKIDLCNRLLNYLDQKFESKSIAKEEYEDNQNKIKFKIKQLETQLNNQPSKNL